MKKQKIIGMAVLNICLLVIFGYSFYSETRKLSDLLGKDKAGVAFSVQDGFYLDDIEVKIKPVHKYGFLSEIHYTMDGSEPTLESEIYKHPILLSSDSNKMYVIRAAAFYKGEKSKTATASYVLGKDSIAGHNIPVVSITGNPDDFFGYENGVLVPGKLYDEYLANGGTEPAGWRYPANFNELTWEKEVHFTYIDQVQGVLIDQDASFQLTGNSSRKYEIKPFKISFEKKQPYEFAGLNESSSAAYIKAYKTFKFRNGGIDFGESQIRNKTLEKLAREAGFDDILPIQKAAVYINGELYGIYDMQPLCNTSYLSALYELDKDDIEIIKGGETDVLKAAGYSQNWHYDADNPEEKEQFLERVDIENLFRYYAFELIAENGDWPLNNQIAWRYTGEKIEGNPYSDGRFRYILYDLDSTMQCLEDAEDPFLKLFYNTYGAGKDNEEGVEQDNSLWCLLPDLLRDEEYKNEFVNILMDNMSDVFDTQNVLDVIAATEAEYADTAEFWANTTDSEEIKEVLANRASSVAEMIDEVTKRKETVYAYIYQYFQGETVYDLQISAPDAGDIIQMGSVRVYSNAGEVYTSTRCGEYDTVLKAIPGPGKEFDCFLVNGTPYYEAELILTDSVRKGADTVSVSLKTKENGPVLAISEISEKGDSDFVELYNPSLEPVYLGDYFLSDDRDDLEKYQCPDVTLMPGEVIWINGRSNPVEREYIMNFNLKEDEFLCLTKVGETEPEDMVLVPEMRYEETYGRYLETNEFRYFNHPNGGVAN